MKTIGKETSKNIALSKKKAEKKKWNSKACQEITEMLCHYNMQIEWDTPFLDQIRLMYKEPRR